MADTLREAAQALAAAVAEWARRDLLQMPLDVLQGIGAVGAALSAPDEIAWLRRLLQWCETRLKHDVYRETLRLKLAEGPTAAPDPDEPKVVHAAAAPTEVMRERARLLGEAVKIGHDFAYASGYILHELRAMEIRGDSGNDQADFIAAALSAARCLSMRPTASPHREPVASDASEAK